MGNLNRRRLLLWPLASGFALHPLALWAQAGDDYLEAVDGPDALAWVNGRNDEALALIEREPNFTRRRRETLSSLSSAINISIPSRSGDHLYHFYRSARRPHGLWRRTTLENYAKEEPSWENLLDVGDIARDESRNVTLMAYNVHAASQRALLFFSLAGEDKLELREFDIRSRRFVDGGFQAPTAKLSAHWFNADEIVIATDTGPGSLTESGYPMAVRRWKRGTPLLDAPELWRGQPGDMSMGTAFSGREGLPPAVLLQRRVRFFETERQLLRADGSLARLDVPVDASAWLAHDWMLVTLRTPWTVAGKTHPEGSLLALPASEAGAPARPLLLLEGQPRRRIVRADVVRDGFITSYTDNQKARLAFLRREQDTVRAVQLPVPESGLVTTWADRAAQNNRIWLLTQAPLQPQSFTLIDAAAPAAPVLAKTQGAAFDAGGMQVQQLEARSRDGTLVPYTVMGPAQPKPGAPTLLYGYGGFGIAIDLDYQRLPGINWLQYGGIQVLAHIRGGGEFGPAWHQAAKGTARQNGFDDFIAVAEDLVRRGITEPKRLGIYGASNGGALVTAVLVQRPDLFGAVVSRVPLTDMLGFAKLSAGPSWIEEYGDPGQPADRAILARWSPYQNASPAAGGGKPYPPTLFIGNRNDDRVHPAHARKMAARMKALGHERTWLYEEMSGGHLGRSDPRIQAQREALIYSFLWLQLAKEG